MSDSDVTPSNHFIRQKVRDDLAAGRVPDVVRTRFPPEPNGYLHIGHAKSICLNFGIAKEFDGECNLRYDDTNPEKENTEFVDAIAADVAWLGFEWPRTCFASDYFEQLFGFALALIDKGLAYVDDQDSDTIRATRGTLTEPGQNSPWRDRTPAENRSLFDAMRAGDFADGEKVLRAKIDMASPNINLRDPLLYRIRRAHHHRTGDTWCLYPLYDFTHGLSDALEGVTHSLCTLEFADH
ncbi:MAG: glutamate--tRNA ligase family protein, partial [Pseudomonadota bacterium]